MAGASYIKGPIRTILFSQENYPVSSGGVLLTSLKTTPYARFTGEIASVGSITVQYRMASSSLGTSTSSPVFGVTSSFIVNSGVATFNVENFGVWTEFRFSAANSQVANTVLVVGEPAR